MVGCFLSPFYSARLTVGFLDLEISFLSKMLKITVLFAKVIYRPWKNNRFINSRYNPLILGTRTRLAYLPISRSPVNLSTKNLSKIFKSVFKFAYFDREQQLK